MKGVRVGTSNRNGTKTWTHAGAVRESSRNGKASSLGARSLWAWATAVWLLVSPGGFAQPGPSPGPGSSPRPASAQAAVTVLEIDGAAEFMTQARPPWRALAVNSLLQPGDQVRVHARSRLLLRLSDRSTVRFSEGAEFRIEPSTEPQTKAYLHLLRGLLYLFHRDEPASIGVKHRTVSAAIRGTEFAFGAAGDGGAFLTLIEGQVELSNEAGRVELASGEEGLAEPGRPPTKTSVINAFHRIQWCLYYPAVLDPDEFGPMLADRTDLAESLAAYRQGALPQALAKYPPDHQPASAAERLYLAALILASGQVEEAERLLSSPAIPSASPVHPLAQALRQMVEIVKEPARSSSLAPPAGPGTATAWLVESYRQQALARLTEALQAAQQAVARSPRFAFGWARVAELEFSFGRAPAARRALEKSLSLAPRNAQAVTLRGFLLAAENKTAAAIDAFNEAMAIDGALGNAWLGRGLCQMRRGRVEAGRADLQVAVTLEPQRAVLRSYLGKGWHEAGDATAARKEIQLAKQLDANDPTAWLYSALMLREANRLNEGVAELERSQALVENRRIIRSGLLLDQDHAVESANLARLYQEAGLFDRAVREAAQALNADYANYSAHWFLANAYAQLSDPNQANLRYETPRLSEYLVGNLLAPAGAGLLSSTISQQEYSRLFIRDRPGIISSTEYLSRGAWSQAGALYGLAGPLGYSFEADYQSDPGQRPNQDFEQETFSLQLKQQLTSQDSLYFQGFNAGTRSGDTAFYYDPKQANPELRLKEELAPGLLAGYHREWAPAIHSLVLGGRLPDRIELRDPLFSPLLVTRSDPSGPIEQVFPFQAQQHYHNELALYTAEAQQIFQSAQGALILGSRFQTAEVETRSRLDIPSQLVTNDTIVILPDSFFNNPPQHIFSDFQRWTAYGYAHWQPVESVRLIGGLDYEELTYPANVRLPPLVNEEATQRRLLPKGGLIWSPWRETTLRAAYSQSLGGFSLDQSFQLEPTQVAGLNQSWRSLIPESIAGANAGARFETWAVAWDQAFPTRTYLGVTGERLASEVDRAVGVFDSRPPFVPPFITQASTRESLDFEERRLSVAVDQLVGQEWSFGAAYRVSRAELEDRFPEVPAAAGQFGGFSRASTFVALLHQLDLHLTYNHPAGWFAQAQAFWYGQDNLDDAANLRDDAFWQLNLFAGYRFARRRAELRLGLLNVTGQDYRLNPLNLAEDLPRKRTLALGLKLNF